MNCHEAEQQIFEERDGALGADEVAALSAHVAHCATCRQTRDNLAAAMESWRVNTGTAAVPDADREWQAVRRRKRNGVDLNPKRAETRRHNVIPWLAVPLAAAAAIAFSFFASPDSPRTPAPAPATADLAAPPTGDASTVVFVDEKSGWLVVWASAASPKHI
jgi:hypothetical protein